VPARHTEDPSRCRAKPTCRLVFSGTACRDLLSCPPNRGSTVDRFPHAILLHDIVVCTLQTRACEHREVHVRAPLNASPTAHHAQPDLLRDRAFGWSSAGAPCTPPRSSRAWICRCTSLWGGSASGHRGACRHRSDGAVSQALERGPLARPQARYRASRLSWSAPTLSSSRRNTLTLAGVQWMSPALQQGCCADVLWTVIGLLLQVHRR
jgi:hypothetical protein